MHEIPSSGTFTYLQARLVQPVNLSVMSLEPHTDNAALSFETVETFCLFVGYPRSGHSLVGALLNAHPDVVIAHELGVLDILCEQSPSRDELYWLLLQKDQDFSSAGNSDPYYGYNVPGQWQGRVRTLKCIGDKKGGQSSLRLYQNPELLNQLRNIVAIPMRLVHVVRNPFDTISTMASRTNTPLEDTIERYFHMCEAVHDTHRAVAPTEWITLYHEEFISEPKAHLRNLFSFLNLPTDEALIDSGTALVHDAPSRTRHDSPWSPALIDDVHRAMEAFPLLNERGYSFEN